MSDNLFWFNCVINIEYPYSVDLGTINSLIEVIKKKIRVYEGTFLDFWSNSSQNSFNLLKKNYIKSVHVRVVLPLTHKNSLINSLQNIFDTKYFTHIRKKRSKHVDSH